MRPESSVIDRVIRHPSGSLVKTDGCRGDVSACYPGWGSIPADWCG